MNVHNHTYACMNMHEHAHVCRNMHGTVQVFRNTHENAEASWSFVRDGTVSWFHGIRYIARPGMDTNVKTNNNAGGENNNMTFLTQVK